MANLAESHFKADLALEANQDLIDEKRFLDLQESSPSSEEELKDNIIHYKQYMTPEWLSKYICNKYILDSDYDILEPSCGNGSFIKNIPKSRRVVGVEIDKQFRSDLLTLCGTYEGTFIEKENWAKKGNFELIIGDFLQNNFRDKKFDLIIGNPPFGADTESKNTCLDLEFVCKGIDLLKPNGRIVFLLETKFLHGVKRFEKLWESKASLASIKFLARRPSFEGFKGTATRDCSILEIKRRDEITSPVSLSWIYFKKEKDVKEKPVKKIKKRKSKRSSRKKESSVVLVETNAISCNDISEYTLQD